MDILILSAWFSPAGLLSLAMVIIGLGFVIFFHELGHFAVAKWCDVEVERFSIGFGPVIWSRTWGETEYALSAIPFGGYVKMLGQDDIDPGQETSTEIAENPRSYTAKNVPQRMAIISAGVIMNVITGYLFYVAAMWMGIQVPTSEVGFVQPGMPAWEAGIRPGDEIVAINGREVQDFNDITRGTALSQGSIQVVGKRPSGETYDVVVTPDRSGTKRMIGVGRQRSPQIPPFPPEKKVPAAVPGTPAATVAGDFQPGDKIVEIAGTPIEAYADLQQVLTERREESLEFTVQRLPPTGSEGHKETTIVTIPPQRYRWLGLRVEVGEIEAIQKGSPAAEAGLEVNDRIIKVQPPEAEAPLEVGRDVDPALLPDWFADYAGQDVVVTIEREGIGGETKSFSLTPTSERDWATAYGAKSPMPIPAMGVAYEFVPRVIAVAPDSPADQKGIKPNDVIVSAEFVKPSDWPEALGQILGNENVTVEIGESGWTHVMGLMQVNPTWDVTLTLKPGGQEPTRTVTLQAVDHPDRFAASDRGLILMLAAKTNQAESVGEAFALGWHQTGDSMMDIYLTLRGLFSGNISPKELHGPIGIFSIGVQIAESGLSQFLLFLGFLSVNLAVLNFLPIPVLDGGHMVFLIWEGLTRKRPNERVYATAMYFGLLFVLGLMGWVIYLDIMRRIA